MFPHLTEKQNANNQTSDTDERYNIEHLNLDSCIFVAS